MDNFNWICAERKRAACEFELKKTLGLDNKALSYIHKLNMHRTLK